MLFLYIRLSLECTVLQWLLVTLMYIRVENSRNFSGLHNENYNAIKRLNGIDGCKKQEKRFLHK